MSEEMTLEDIEITIKDYVHAAKCAIEAGFDGVEVVRPLSFPPLRIYLNHPILDLSSILYELTLSPFSLVSGQRVFTRPVS